MKTEGIVANRGFINKNNECRTLGLSTQTPFFFASAPNETEERLGEILCTSYGEKLTFRRLHSTDLGPAGIVGGACDVYESRTEDGRMYRKLVVNDYCDQTTSVAPIGFSFSPFFNLTLSNPIIQSSSADASRIFCRKCGEALFGDSLFCHKCGEKVIQTNNSQNSTKKAQPSNSAKPVVSDKKPLGMAWYGFLIHFALIVGAVLNIIYSIGYFTGSIYSSQTSGQVTAEEVYLYYGSALQILDVLYGIFLIGFAILAFVLRYKLKNYKKDAFKFVCIFYSISAAIPFIYSITVTLITSEAFTASAVSSLIVHLLFLIFNTRYFKKRAHLFIR